MPWPWCKFKRIRPFSLRAKTGKMSWLEAKDRAAAAEARPVALPQGFLDKRRAWRGPACSQGVPPHPGPPFSPPGQPLSLYWTEEIPHSLKPEGSPQPVPADLGGACSGDSWAPEVPRDTGCALEVRTLETAGGKRAFLRAEPPFMTVLPREKSEFQGTRSQKPQDITFRGLRAARHPLTEITGYHLPGAQSRAHVS